ncbi:MAG TPA: hypothetical protein VGD08_14080 [Stellaceae bacterium]|jgi:hypothetical protein
MIKSDELRALLDAESGPAVSVYLPTHVAGREIRQDPIRFHNLIDRAAERLTSLGMRRPEVEAFLGEARSLAADEEFWRHQDRGLAVFVAPGLLRTLKLPFEPNEESVVSRHFHVTPLLPLFQEDHRFFVLAASAGNVRLFEASQHAMNEVKDIDLPSSVAAITGETEYENTRHMAPVARTRAGTPGGVVKTHNFGETPEEQRKAQLVEYLNRVAARVEDYLSGRRAPVVIAAEPEVKGHLGAIIKDKLDLAGKGVEMNPDAFGPEEIHRRAWALVQPEFAETWHRDMDRLNALIGEATGRATLKPEEIVKAAREGRIDTLFIADGEHLWGRFDEDGDKVIAHGSQTEDDDDLIDVAALLTLRTGGNTYVLPKQELPRSGIMAAILRY